MSIPPRDNVNHAEGRDRSSENHHENTNKIAGSFSHSEYRSARDHQISTAAHGASSYMPPGEVRRAGLNFQASNPDSITSMVHRELGAHQQLSDLMNRVERMGHFGRSGADNGRTQHSYESVPQPGQQNPRHDDPNHRAAALVAHAERTGRNVGTVGECAKGVRLALEKVGFHFQAPNAVSFGRQLENSGHFDRLPLHQAQPGDIIVRNWNHNVQAAHGGKNNGDVVVVTGQNRDGSLRGANDHIVHQIPGDGGRYRGSYVLRMKGAGDTQVADGGHAPNAGPGDRQQYAQGDNQGNPSDKPNVRPASYTPDNGDVQAQWHARGTGYYPANNRMEGGFTDRKGAPLHTLQDFLEHPDKTPYVSVAMDSKAARYGTSLHIPEMDNKYRDQLNAMGLDHIPFKVVDTGGAFRGKGTSRIDICTRNSSASHDSTVNGPLTLQVVNDGQHDVNPNYRYAQTDPASDSPHGRTRQASFEPSGGSGSGRRHYASHGDSHSGGGHSGHSRHSSHGDAGSGHAGHGGHSRHHASRGDGGAGHSRHSFQPQPQVIGYDEDGNPIYGMPEPSQSDGQQGDQPNPDGSQRSSDGSTPNGGNGRQQPGQDGSTPGSNTRPAQDGSTPRQQDSATGPQDSSSRPGQDSSTKPQQENTAGGGARPAQADAGHTGGDRVNPAGDRSTLAHDGDHTRNLNEWGSFYRSQTRGNNCLPTSMSMMYADWRKGAPANDGELRQIERITHVGASGGYQGSTQDIEHQAKTVMPGLHTQGYEGLNRQQLAQTLDKHLSEGHSAIVGIKSPYSGGNHYIYVAGKDKHGDYIIGDSGRHGGGLLGKTIQPNDLVNRMMARNGGSRFVAGWMEDAEGNVAHR